MNLLQPWGLLGLAALLPVIALYFLKLKREQRVVPSTLLWKKVIDDLQVNSPFQRLKYSLLLLMQLLLISLMAFALARPYLSAAGYAGAKTILMVDTSASMSTCDAGPRKDEPRLDVALREATSKVDDMRPGDEMMVLAFDRDVRQLSKFTPDRALLRQVLASLHTRDVETRATEAFETAAGLCATEKDVRVLVLSDGCFGDLKLSSDEGAATQSESARQGRRRSLVRHRPDATAEGGAIGRAEGAIARFESRVGRPPEVACRDAAIRQDHCRRSPEPCSGKGGKRCVSVAAADFHSRAAAHSADSGDQGESEIPEKVAGPFDRTGWCSSTNPKAL
ncbi:MAG: VWA domain-containing protein [Planctomycetota bacterium]